MIVVVLRALFSRIDSPHQDTLHKMAAVWLRDPNYSLQRAALQVVGAFIDAYEKSYSRHLVTTFPILHGNILLLSVPPEIAEEADADVPVDDDHWDILYMSLTSLAKLFRVFPDVLGTWTHLQSSGNGVEGGGRTGTTPAKRKRVLVGDVTATPKLLPGTPGTVLCSEGNPAGSNTVEASEPSVLFWHAVKGCLLYSHTWVRLAAARLLGLYFAARVPETLLVGDTRSDVLCQNSTLFTIGKSLCRQIESTHVDEALRTQIVKNLFFVGRALFQVYLLEPLTPRVPRAPKRKAERSGEPDEGDCNDSNDDVISDNDDDIIGDGIDDGPGGTKQIDVATAQPSGLVWTFKQLSYLARTETTKTPSLYHRREIIFKFFAAMANYMPTSVQLTPFLIDMIRPLYRTELNGLSPDSIKELVTFQLSFL